jgi:diaminopimelate epimerase
MPLQTHASARGCGRVADFVKYQALGNDYLLVDPLSVVCAQDAQTARRLCDRHFGIGADGVLFGPTAPVGPGMPVGLTIFNSDGSSCERSANGIRMFALHLAEHYLDATEFTVRTLAGDSVVEVSDAAAGLVRIGMGQPSFEAHDIPVTGRSGPSLSWPLDVEGETLEVTSVANGNPHAVLFLDDLPERRVRELGPRIAGHPRFPQRCNVEFVQVADREAIDIRIWERGAGYTLASGAGACAAASAAHALGLVDDALTVRMPGGDVRVTFADDGQVWLTGVVEQVASGDLSPVLRERLGFGRRRPMEPAGDRLAGRAVS